MLANVAEVGAERMQETIGKAKLRDAAIGTGIAVDKMLALTGQLPVGIQIANIPMPTPEQNEARRRAHHALDEITRLLRKQEPLSEKEELMLKAQCRVLKITRTWTSKVRPGSELAQLTQRQFPARRCNQAMQSTRRIAC